MQKILISQCLLGEKVKYNGGDNFVDSDIISQWQEDGRIVAVCPEVSGGLSIPRTPADVVGKSGGYGVLEGTAKVIDKNNLDVTEAFLKGANAALALVKKHNIKVAILKERSPSCGVHTIYDGKKHKKIPGWGVTTEILRREGVKVFSENEIDLALDYLKNLENRKKPYKKDKALKK